METGDQDAVESIGKPGIGHRRSAAEQAEDGRTQDRIRYESLAGGLD